MCIDPDFVIRVELEDGDPRVCDYCNAFLVGEDGIAAEDCFSTDYGLVCRKCLGDIKPLSSHRQGDYVKEERWYKGR
ncbi:MAG: hypothetical protein COV72_07120 [Candidatus Omnitrophica bacterium CG11_big_fil_rev_8_21_14_0_20_42_13]|uniref:Uncharacterized protein n=1 Tax=Candidatus Ghiorseimicrobium undicola TaxID=1974746 RepID=A0A2H0LWD1_9BACT|nr:MAG: hypothetical protein COV72_07120 [Candidatus Omnitrophica bacterium CG11_big_fil_rev_8_21_14_0_20_42_13]